MASTALFGVAMVDCLSATNSCDERVAGDPEVAKEAAFVDLVECDGVC